MMAVELQDRQEALQACVTACLQQLQRLQLVDCEAEELRPTHLGSAVLASALGPDEGLAVFCELEKVRRCVALDTDLHLVYMVSSSPSFPDHRQDQASNKARVGRRFSCQDC